jgi:hypothetical protein
MLKDAKHVANLADGILDIVCNEPSMAYAHAITRILKARCGNTFTNALDIGCMLQMLVKEEWLQPAGIVPGRGRSRYMYAPTWKAFLYLKQRARAA